MKYQAKWTCQCGATGITEPIESDTEAQGKSISRKNAIIDGSEHIEEVGCSARGVRITDYEEAKK